MKIHFYIVLILIFYSCYHAPKIEGFDQGSWQMDINCSRDRLNEADILLAKEEILLSASQNEIKALLGEPDEHELYNRNQKFFYYDLSVDCDTLPAKRLSLRFDALGRLNDINIIRVKN